MRRAIPAVLLLWAAAAAPAPAQERLATVLEQGTPVMATEVLVATGPMDEGEGQEGLSYLAARAVTDPIRGPLDALGAHLLVTPQKDAVAFSLIAAPDAWEEASRMLMLALFRDPPIREAIVRQREAIRAELDARDANPADAAVRELERAFYGADHAWSRSTVGSVRVVDSLSVEEVDAFLRANFTPERAVTVTLGPLDPRRVREHLLPYVGSSPWAPPRTARAEPAREPVERDYQTITTWISAAYSFPAAASEETMRLLAHRAEEMLSFAPTRRSVFNVRSEVIPRAAGGEIRFQLVVPPGEAEQWAQRMEAVVEELGRVPLSTEDFQALLRRYRGTRLLALAAPEARARETARRLLTTGRAADPVPDIDALTAERLRDAARGLSRPTIVFLGPFFDE